MAVDVRAWRPRTARTFAGLTGPAIKPLALRMVYQCAQAVSIPIVGCGGISSGRDAVEYLLAGAHAIQVGTATYRDPARPCASWRRLSSSGREQEIAALDELVGPVTVPSARGARTAAGFGV